MRTYVYQVSFHFFCVQYNNVSAANNSAKSATRHYQAAPGTIITSYSQ